FGAEGDDLIDGRTVFAFEAVEVGQTIFNFGQMFGRGVDAAGVVAQGGADIFHADAGGFEGGKGFVKFGLVARQFFDVFLGGAQRRGGGSVAFVEQVEGVHGGAV